MFSKRCPLFAIVLILGPVLQVQTLPGTRSVFETAFLGTAVAGGPSVEEVSTGVGQRGKSFELKLTGSGFADGCDFLFYRPGLTCTSVKVDSDSSMSATLQAAEDCPIGSHPFRIQGKDGLSELRVARIVPLPLVTEIEPNNNAAESQLIPAGNTVVGVLSSGDLDCYKLTMKRGQRLSAEIESVRLAAHLSDLKLSVLDSRGTVIASADDTMLGKQDPYLTLIATEDADYVVRVDASGVDGNDNTRYALHLGSFPRPDYVFPMGGPIDKPTNVQIRGDITVEWKESPTFNEVGTIDFFPTHLGLSPPTPIPFRVSTFDNALEVEPNDQKVDVSPNATNLPVAFNGIISKPGDKDMYRFHAEAGWTIEFAAFAAQLGSLTDTVIRILSEDGTVLTTADDSSGHDSCLVWECNATGPYLLQVTDKRRSGGDRHVYRIEVRRVDPTVDVFLPRRDRRNQSRQFISVPQGNRSLGFIGVKRQRWTGDAEIDFPELPEGTKAQFGRVNEDEYVIPVVFEASKEARLGANLIPVIARAYLRSPTILGTFEQPVDLIAESADRLYQGVNVNRMAMAVVEPAPYKIQFDEPPTQLPRDGSLELMVHVERDPGYEGAIDVSIPFLPTWVDGPEKITILADKSVGVFELRAHPEADTCTWPTVAEGKPSTAGPSPEASVAAATGQAAAAPPAAGGQMRRPRGGRLIANKGGHEVASQLISLVIAESPLQGEISKLMATPGTEFKLTIPLKRSGEVPANLNATLVGLPSRVAADAISITEKSNELVFTVRLEDDAPLGLFANLFCEMAGDWNGHKVTYRIGRGGSLKIVPPSELVVDATGRPLSLLEILRSQPLDGEAPANAKPK